MTGARHLSRFRLAVREWAGLESAAVCTLVIGFHTVAKDSVLLAANRDEDPSRPSAPPGVLLEAQRVVGGRDLL